MSIYLCRAELLGTTYCSPCLSIQFHLWLCSCKLFGRHIPLHQPGFCFSRSFYPQKVMFLLFLLKYFYMHIHIYMYIKASLHYVQTTAQIYDHGNLFWHCWSWVRLCYQSIEVKDSVCYLTSLSAHCFTYQCYHCSSVHSCEALLKC